MVKRGDVYWVELDPTRGREIRKTRPAIIVNDDSLGKLPLKVVVPVTDWKDRYEIAPWMIKIEPGSKNSLTKNSSADCFQIRSLSKKRFVKKIGEIDVHTQEKIKDGLAKILTLNNY